MNVSFIIPAYNESNYIDVCLGSIYQEIRRWNHFNSKDDKFEVIVVDNNSVDGTDEIAKSYGATVVYELKKGITHARQAGFKAAKYDIQAYIDADNFLQYGWLDNLKEFDDPEVVAISGPPYYHNFNIFYRTCAALFYKITMIAHKFGPTIQGGNYVVRKSALEKIGGHSTDILFYGEDTDLALRLSKVGKIKLLPKMWIYFSDRRFKTQGYFDTTFTYIINYFSVHILKRPVTLNYIDIRTNDNKKI